MSTIKLNDIATKRITKYENRPTIVFLHDSLGCITLWRDFPEKLCDIAQCNAIIYDRQGYGQSCDFSYDKRALNYLEQEADILIELLDHWKVEKAVLFGHSDGGSIALLAAAKYPNRISAIITEGAHIYTEEVTLQGIRDAVQLYETTPLKARLEKYHGDKTEKVFQMWTATWLRQEFKDLNMEHFLPKIQCPALIIQGEDDEYGSLNQVHDTVRQIKEDAQALIIPNVKHTPHKEVPEIILKKSNQFIQNTIIK